MYKKRADPLQAPRFPVFVSTPHGSLSEGMFNTFTEGGYSEQAINVLRCQLQPNGLE